MITLALALVALVAVFAIMQRKLREARAASEALRSIASVADQKLIRVLESVRDGVLTLDKEWRIAYVNPRGEQMLGRPRDRLVGQHILEAFPESVGSAIHREMDRARRENAFVEIESLYSPGDRWFEVRGYPQTDGSMTVYFRDVTKRRRAQEALRLQARMLDTVRQAVIAIAPDGVIFYWNHAAEELLGWRADQVVGLTTIAMMQPDLDSDDADAFLARLAKGESFAAETVMRRRDGKQVPAMVMDTPILDENDAVVGMVRVVTDMTERQADQQAQRFLADAGSELAATLDLEALLTAVGLLAVPTLGECCIIDVAEEEDVARYIDSTWAPELAGGGEMHFDRRVYAEEAHAAALVAEGRTVVFRRATDTVLRAITTDPVELERLRAAGGVSAMVAPLKAGGRELGTMAVLSSQRTYSEADSVLFTEFARRVALAADNAILYVTARLASQSKSDFLAVMSHELRTPLTTVMGYTDLLLAEVTGGLADKPRNYLERIRGAAWHLLGLIEQILIYTRVEVGREQVHVERVVLDFVLRDAAGLIEPVAAEKGLSFKLIEPAQPGYLDTDLTKLRQILLNLLSNAVKFTDEGEVVLEARVLPDTIEFVVRDTGIGIAAENLDRIFDSFWQVDQSATRRVGGTGLGLSVARKLARLLGGDIAVTSVADVGTTFVVQLPRARISRPPHGASA